MYFRVLLDFFLAVYFKPVFCCIENIAISSRMCFQIHDTTDYGCVYHVAASTEFEHQGTVTIVLLEYSTLCLHLVLYCIIHHMPYLT